jgi:hypothetical protein
MDPCRLIPGTSHPGKVVHEVGDEGDPMRALAETIAPNSPAHHSSPGGEFRVPRSRLLRRPARIERDHPREVGWQPTHPSLLETEPGASHVHCTSAVLVQPNLDRMTGAR